MNYLKRTTLFVAATIILSTSLFGGAVLSDFHAEAGVNQVVLKWIATAETNLKGYQISRSFDGVSFEKIAFVEAKSNTSGEKTYTYIDKSVFKSTGRTYYYKLFFIQTDDSSAEYGKVITVEPTISIARQTWGSIKAMFR
jgi:hypothetical protein